MSSSSASLPRHYYIWVDSSFLREGGAGCGADRRGGGRCCGSVVMTEAEIRKAIRLDTISDCAKALDFMSSCYLQMGLEGQAKVWSKAASLIKEMRKAEETPND